jgi:hypothetical protein
MSVRCHVLESPGPPADGDDEDPDEMVFDAAGTSLGGLIRARFRFTVFKSPPKGEGDGSTTAPLAAAAATPVVMATAQERIDSPLRFLVPPARVLEGEHRHTFRDLDASFAPSPAAR